MTDYGPSPIRDIVIDRSISLFLSAAGSRGSGGKMSYRVINFLFDYTSTEMAQQASGFATLADTVISSDPRFFRSLSFPRYKYYESSIAANRRVRPKAERIGGLANGESIVAQADACIHAYMYVRGVRT